MLTGDDEKDLVELKRLIAHEVEVLKRLGQVAEVSLARYQRQALEIATRLGK